MHDRVRGDFPEAGDLAREMYPSDRELKTVSDRRNGWTIRGLSSARRTFFDENEDCRSDRKSLASFDRLLGL